MPGTGSDVVSPLSSGAPVVDGAGAGADSSEHDRARDQARQLWADLTHARAAGDPRAIASAEDALFRFYLPVAHALGDGVVGRSVTAETARHAAELGLAQAVLSWPASDDGFLRFASRCITTVLRHLRTSPAGRHSALTPLVFPPLPGTGPAPAPGSHSAAGAPGASA
jgi:hypothetical protein